MSSTSTPGKRKRGRPRNTDEAESSPLPAKTTLSAIKRQRLNSYEPGLANTGILSSVRKGIGHVGGLLGFNAVKENLDPNPRSTRSTPKKDIWEVEVSEEEDEGQVDTKGRKQIQRPNERALESKVKIPPRTTSTDRSIRYTKTVQVRDEHGGILSSATRTTRRGTRRAQSAESSQPATSDDAEAAECGVETTPTRTRRRGRHASQVNNGGEAKLASKVNGTPRRRGRPKRAVVHGDVAEDATRTPETEQRNAVVNEADLEQNGIERGSKDISSRKKKYPKHENVQVMIETRSSESITDELAEELVDTRKSNKTQPYMAKKSKVQAVEEDSDTECAICGGLASEPPNEMLLCDECDLGVHQECYNVPEVPEGDWFCRECQATKDLVDFDAENAEEELAVLPSQLPDIENIEQHLRICQRIVLDKLTGQTRVAIRGHDEEMQKVHQLVEQTVVAGEGNSMLIIGSRGSGKTNVRCSYNSMNMY